MRYLFLLLFVLMPVMGFADHPGAFDELHEQGLLAAIIAALSGVLGLGQWMVRTWWKARLERQYKPDVVEEAKHKARVEKKLESGWTNGDETLPGKSNPGRTQAQLTEVVHEDLQQYKAETNRRFDLVHGDLGKIKGKLGID